MNLLTAITTSAKMTSQEIADLTKVRHDNVKRTIEKLVQREVIRLPQIEITEENNNLGFPQKTKLYIFTIEQKRDTIVVVAQLSPELTAKLVDRWEELEKEHAAQMPAVPQTYSEALRLAVNLSEIIQDQAKQIEHQKPAVEFLDRFVEAKSAKGFREVAKVLGVREGIFVKWLLDSRIVYRQVSGVLLPFAHYQDQEYFAVKLGESNGHAFHQTRFTPKGIEWIAGRYNREHNGEVH